MKNLATFIRTILGFDEAVSGYTSNHLRQARPKQPLGDGAMVGFANSTAQYWAPVNSGCQATGSVAGFRIKSEMCGRVWIREVWFVCAGPPPCDANTHIKASQAAGNFPVMLKEEIMNASDHGVFSVAPDYAE
ncbi:MAG: hypothetical protein H7Y43_10720 [Akkermansiaceae bacterium]|nr:hypothetical protein [Verrucomicrobiales bacterium]